MNSEFDILLIAPSPQVRRTSKNSRSAELKGFTLVELLISTSIFGVVVVIVSSLYVDMIRLNVKANLQKQIYSEAQFLMKRLEREIHNSMIDYDEYYAQNVVIPGNSKYAKENFGQNYGRYYSSFYNTGSDEKLGFDCSDGSGNTKDCKPLSKTVDKNTGQNPFEGKQGYSGDVEKESAFCGTVNYKTIADTSPAPSPTGKLPWDDSADLCDLSKPHPQHELYLISKDAREKTIISREKTGTDSDGKPTYTLSFLKMKGGDTDGDKMIDSFQCADKFDCSDYANNLPDKREFELNPEGENWPDANDPKDIAFGKDFVPILPININVTRFDVYIFPNENPHYAFAENNEKNQPYASIVLTFELNQKSTDINKEMFEPITFVKTVYPKIRASIPAPVLYEK